MFVVLGVQAWGSLDVQTTVAQVHEERKPGDDDLLDLAAVHTFLNRGSVYAVERDRVPSGGQVAAILRY
jgi:hypothetical protein